MTKRVISYLDDNVPILMKFCDDNEYIYHEFSRYHYRIAGAVAIVDVYPSRMVHNIISIDGVEQRPNFKKTMKQRIDIQELQHLLERGFV